MFILQYYQYTNDITYISTLDITSTNSAIQSKY